jgi:hypothetical protein
MRTNGDSLAEAADIHAIIDLRAFDDALEEEVEKEVEEELLELQTRRQSLLLL